MEPSAAVARTNFQYGHAKREPGLRGRLSHSAEVGEEPFTGESTEIEQGEGCQSKHAVRLLPQAPQHDPQVHHRIQRKTSPSFEDVAFTRKKFSMDVKQILV